MARNGKPRVTAGLLSTVTGEITSPGEDSTGAGAEREWGFDPQSKAEVAQGEYKGAREVLAQHVHTAQPRGGPGCANDPADDPGSRPSRVGCPPLMADDTWWHVALRRLRTGGGGGNTSTPGTRNHKT
jgi:hypothetical protein